MEDIRFVKGGDRERMLNAAVTLVEPMGANTHLRMKINDNEVIACVNPHTEVKIGETAELLCDLRRSCLFDKSSGRLHGPGE
jgi:multiple sugar transport system ATP-binding protein